jgi:hypothetical protein
MRLHGTLPLLLLLASATLSREASLLARMQLHGASARSAPDLALSSGLSLNLNSTEALCYFLLVPEIASTFSEECGLALAQLDAPPSIGSEEEKVLLREVCTGDCVGKVIEFFAEECQDTVVASSLVGLCAASDSVPCHYITNTYNWTSLSYQCAYSLDGDVEECSQKCSEAVSEAVEVVGCCSNYDYHLSFWGVECDLDMPRHCPDPFKEEKDDDKEDKGSDKDSDKTEGSRDKTGGEKPSDVDIDSFLGESSDSASRPVSTLLLTLLLLFLTC